MPWCEPCSKYLSPSTVRSDGACPHCGSQVEAPVQLAADRLGDERAPWHFKLLVVAVAGYLGWRLIQMIGWLA